MTDEIKTPQKMNPAELIQKAMNATAELQEILERLETNQGEIKAAIRALYKEISEVKTTAISSFEEISEVKVKVDYVAECVQRHTPIPPDR